MQRTGPGRREGRDYPPDVLLPGPHQLAVPEAKTLGGEMARAILRVAKGIWRKSSPSCQTVVFLPFGSSIPASLGATGADVAHDASTLPLRLPMLHAIKLGRLRARHTSLSSFHATGCT